jgi:AcrR family transcriptional regulator
VKGRTTSDVVLDAAAAIVAAGGVESLNMSALHFESGVSTGSIYHHFGSRDGVIARLIRRSYGDWKRDLGAVLQRHESDPVAGVRAAIAHRLAWGEERRGEARLVLTQRGSLLADPFAVEPRSVAATLDRWLRAQHDAGRLPRIEARIALPLVFGPADDLLRAWLDAPDDPAPTASAGVLGDAAWAALRAAGS